MIQLRMLEHKLLRYLGIALGCFIASCSINLFLVPSHLLTGGATGIAIIFYYLAGLPIGLQTFLYNIPLLAAAWKTMGKVYTVDIIIGTAIFSACLDATKFLNAYASINDVMLAAIFGGVFNGIGYGIVFRMNGSTGGFDIIGAIVKKYYSLNMGGVIFGFNCLIMLVAAFLFGMAPAMLTLICMFVNAMVTDKVIAGFNSRKAVLIVSDKAENIAEGIMEVGRGVTFLHGQGAFTRRERNVVFVVVTLTQVAKIKLIANAIDSNAFMIIMSANEVMGRGFSLPEAPIGNVIKRYEHDEK
ncbi:MAG: YitT family protein [Selenomonadales bacterium]|nr:YitT family protein [Selenomonadales bacterium]